MRVNLDRPFPRDLQTRVSILQFAVGGLVTFGGIALSHFALNSFGLMLGVVHVSVGLAGLGAAISIVQNRSWSMPFVVGINALTSVYSAISETLIQSMPLLSADESVGSLVGTIIAVIISLAIMYFALSRRFGGFNYSLK